MTLLPCMLACLPIVRLMKMKLKVLPDKMSNENENF